MGIRPVHAPHRAPYQSQPSTESRTSTDGDVGYGPCGTPPAACGSIIGMGRYLNGDTPTFGIYMGTGYDGGGGGAMQRDFEEWADSHGYTLIHYIHDNEWTANYRVTDRVRAEGGRLRVMTDPLTDPDDVFSARDPHDTSRMITGPDGGHVPVDVLFVYRLPQLVAKHPEVDDAQRSALERQMKWVRDNGGKVILFHPEYSAMAASRRIFTRHVEMFDDIDLLWINSRLNPLIAKIREWETDPTIPETYDPGHHRYDEVTGKLWIRQNYLMPDPDAWTADWKPFHDKNLEQLLFLGRPLPWKGYRELLPLKRRLHDAGLDVNVSIMGVNSDFNSKEALYTNPKAPKKDKRLKPGYWYDDSLRSRKELSPKGTIEPYTKVWASFIHADGYQLMRDAGFGMYHTLLEPWNNFIPEAAMLDAIRAGSPLIVPDWYYDARRYPDRLRRKSHAGYPTPNPITMAGEPTTPEETGMLAWNHDDPATDRPLADRIRELAGSKARYDEARERQLAWVKANYDADREMTGMLARIGVTL